MIRRLVCSCLGMLLLLAAALPASALAASPAEARAETDQAAAKVLAELYRLQPHARKSVESAVGYAVFSNFGMKIFFAGGGSGKGYAVDNGSGKKTYMKMVELQAGLGLGIKKFGLVWVFTRRVPFDEFIDSGWEFGAQAIAAAKAEEKGGSFQGAAAIADGVWLYQITDTGLALELTAKGTKYYKDDDLN